MKKTLKMERSIFELSSVIQKVWIHNQIRLWGFQWLEVFFLTISNIIVKSWMSGEEVRDRFVWKHPQDDLIPVYVWIWKGFLKKAWKCVPIKTVNLMNIESIFKKDFFILGSNLTFPNWSEETTHILKRFVDAKVKSWIYQTFSIKPRFFFQQKKLGKYYNGQTN